MANLGGFWGVFLDGLMEMTIDDSSIVPKDENKEARDEDVVSVG